MDRKSSMETKRESSEDMKLKTWKESTKSLLGTIDKYCFQPFSISVVPDELRKWNENAYIPKSISIGPRYKGATRDLQQMEEIKWRYMRTLFARTQQHDGEQISDICMKAILELDGAVRASYVDEIKLDRYELAAIMLYDGCFLLELLISGSKHLSEKLKSKSPAGMEGRSLGRQENAFSDLTLLENQIPLLILNELAQLLFPQFFLHNKDGVYTIESLVLSLLGFYPIPSFITLKAGHFLELTYTSIFEKFLLIQMEQERNNNHLEGEYFELENIIDVEPDSGPNQIKLHRCANRLRAAGITIKAPKTTDEVKNNPRISFNFDMKFDKVKGILEIPPLHIRKTSEARWRNFIAWEHHKMKANSFDINNEKQSSEMDSYSYKCTNWVASVFKGWICCKSNGNEDNKVHDRNQSDNLRLSSSYKCKCTWAALLFSGLICCSSDIELLKDREILVNHTNMKNRDLVKWFHSITDGVDTSIIDPELCKVFTELDTYGPKSYFQKMIIIFWHYFTQILDPIYNLHSFLSEGYNYAAAIGLILTLIQTIYSMVAYHHPLK
ncbi:unnamed protein product [Lupinus luteus]|uniref:Uncharacterized protein n=1 Tax=Lupinus luteus TaxID=3873 RepID=A0AAV1Y4N9_LUPLU